MAIAKPLDDMMVRPLGQSVTVDLNQAFGASGLTYTVETANGTVVKDAVVQDGILSLTVGTGAADLGHSDVRVTARDALGLVVGSDDFRLRVAGENAYTFAVLPDTQDYSDASRTNGPPETFYAMTEWLVANKEAHNIQFVTHVGDITQNNLDSEWVVVERAMRTLDGKIPYAITMGNHDQGTNGTANNYTSLSGNYFTVAEQKALHPSLVPYDREPGLISNSYQTFTAPDGTKWLSLSLEFGAREDVVRWAGDAIEAHPDHRVILTTHAYTNWTGRHDPLGADLYDEGAGYNYGLRNDNRGSTDGETMWRELTSKYPNVNFAFSGHIFGDGAETDLTYSEYGTPSFGMLVNYQNGVSREITGNGNEALGGNGGNGAIRLVTIDPEFNRVTTETYFVALGDYLDGFRVKPELDRNGLTGLYRGHQETFEGVDLGPVTELRAKAQAGNDQLVTLEAGATTKVVTLDAGRSFDPTGDADAANDIAAYLWRDADGEVVATGKTATVALASGTHDLKLEVVDQAGRSNTDAVRVIVAEAAMLAETFNDGNFAGWRTALTGTTADVLAYGSAASFGIDTLPGSGSQGVLSVPALSPAQGLKVSLPSNAGLPATLEEYSLVYDVFLPATSGTWLPFIQTDAANGNDADVFVQKIGGNISVGIAAGGGYFGSAAYGDWHRFAFTFDKNADGVAGTADDNIVQLRRYIDGVQVGGATTANDGRFKINTANGFLILTDESNETTQSYLNSFAFSDKVLSSAEIAALGGTDADGIFAASPGGNTSQWDFNAGSLSASFGAATLTTRDATSGTGWIVKGSANSSGPTQTRDAPEGALYEQSETAGNRALVYDGAGSAAWSNYVMEMTLRTNDYNETARAADAFGAVFYYQNDQNHYRITFNETSNQAKLSKIQGGVETTLATSAFTTTFNKNQDLKVAVENGRIDVSLDGLSVFGGNVVDATNPLTGGTVGTLANGQFFAVYDDVVVTALKTTADAGPDVRTADLDGDGAASVTLNGAGSYGLNGVASYAWTKDGETFATVERPTLTLGSGRHEFTLTVTGQDGSTSSDAVMVEVLPEARVLAQANFATSDISAWRIDNEGDIEAPAAGNTSNWSVADGRLVQSSNIYSKELIAAGATNGNLWNRGWSPLGDGQYVLRKGTNAVYDVAEAYGWTDYAIETTFRSPDNDSVGLLFHYKDAANYYKFEIDDQFNIASLTRLVNGIEEILIQVPANYDLNRDTKLRVEIVDQKIEVFVDGRALLPEPIEDRALTQGTFGLYSWGNTGLQFDDVVVTDLSGVVVAGPVALPASPEDAPVTITAAQLLANASGVGAGSLSIANLVASSGTLVTNADGSYRFTPAANDDTAVTFTYEIRGGGESRPTTATLDLTPVNDAPTVSGPVALPASPEDAPVTITAAQLLGNAVDVEGDTLAVVDLKASSGTLAANSDGSYRFTPVANDDTAVTFTYEISDGSARVATTATLDLTPVNDAPIVSAAITLPASPEDAPVTITAAQLLANASDPERDRLTVVDLQASSGTLATNPDGSYRFTPVADDDTSVTFTYAVSDGSARVATTATLDLTPVADAPTITGSARPDFLFGTSADEMIKGLAGNDIILGNGGRDTLVGGKGDDLVSGGSGDDIFVAESGDGSDIYTGFAGKDWLDLSGTSASAHVDLSLFFGIGRASGAEIGTDWLYGIENVTGSRGNDQLKGGGDVNVLAGGLGDDRIEGGGGADILTGGAGRDTFLFQAIGDSTARNPDRITDFVSGQDLIDLSGIDANTRTRGDQAFSLLGDGDDFTGAGQLRSRYDAASDMTLVEGNVDRDVDTDFAIALSGRLLLQGSDFLL